MSSTFKQFSSQELHDALERIFGFNRFRGNQQAVIENLLNRKDTFVLMPTGGGKSLCYQLPAMIMEGVAVIISPLIALMKNQVDAMRAFSMDEGIAHFINSSLSKSATQRVRDDVINGKTKLLYFAPESLTKEENVELLRKVTVSFFAIDEAHCISEWGHDFRPEYRRIRPIISAIGDAPLIALTATATPKVQLDIQKNLGMNDAQVFKSSFNRPNLYYQVRPKIDVTREIIRFIKDRPGESGIIYCLSRKKVEELAEILKVNDIKALPYHAGIDAATRSANQDMFLMEKVQVIVATIAFGMGIDKPDVRYVIHYDIPKSLEGYYQETGRSGRDGGVGHCMAFYSVKDIHKLEKFMQGKPVAEQEIGKLLLEETVSYAQSTTCRRKTLMHYFGEEYTQENCGSCDNCMDPAPEVEASRETQTVLKLIDSLSANFKADYIVDILMGKNTTIVKSYKHDTHPQFGSGTGQGALFWSAVIRGALLKGLLSKDIENYGVLHLSDSGREYIEHPKMTTITLDRKYQEESSEDSGSHRNASAVVDPQLFAMLKDLRAKISRTMNLPPYVIFQDQSLEDMAIQYPITLADMQKITGVGSGKAQKFGKKFIEVIDKYVKENDIERPEDMVVKSVANKSLNKVFIIRSIDREMNLEDVANAKGLSIDELLDEMESIVGAGTKLNLDYYIYDVMDEDKVEDILEYFHESENDSLQEAESELGGDYTSEEIRLVRIKFLSDIGN